MHDNTFSYFDLFFTKMLSGMVSSYKKRNIHKQRQCVYELEQWGLWNGIGWCMFNISLPYYIELET